MSVISVLTGVMILVWGSAVATEVPAPLYDPVEYRDKSGWRVPDSIPEKADEKILLWSAEVPFGSKSQELVHWDSAWWAHAVVVVVNQPFELVLRELRSSVTSQFGIESQGNSVGRSLSPADETWVWTGPPDGPPDGPWPTFGEGLAQFQLLFERFNPPHEYHIETKPYHLLAEGFRSQLDLRIADLSLFIAKPYTMVLMRRTDHSREWATLGRWPIPLPLKIARTHALVTDTEIALVERLGERVPGIKALYVVPYPGWREKAYWVDFIKGIVRMTERW